MMNSLLHETESKQQQWKKIALEILFKVSIIPLSISLEVKINMQLTQILCDSAFLLLPFFFYCNTSSKTK